MRLYRVTFVFGLAAGYVLGTRAGRERYDQMRKLVRSAADSPAVQQTAGALQARATAMMKTTWQVAATQGRKGAARIRRRGRDSGQTAFTGAATQGNGFVRQPARDDHRPFVPVDGDFGDHDLS